MYFSLFTKYLIFHLVKQGVKKTIENFFDEVKQYRAIATLVQKG
jgi:hypothetical protein